MQIFTRRKCSTQSCLISIVSLQSLLVFSIFGYFSTQFSNSRHDDVTRRHRNKNNRVFPPGELLPDSQNVCIPASNFVFIKTHKTGSTTLRSITSRYGYTRNLSFLLSNDGRIGHFNGIFLQYSPNKSNFLPPIGVKLGDFPNYRDYNISNVHLRYTRDGVNDLMFDPKSLRMFTILRSPAEQWLSWFQYYRKYRRLKGFTSDNISLAAMPYMNSLERENGDFNQQSRDLGIKDRHHFNDSILNQITRDLDEELTLVLITEYFDESLILLKKLMCWSFEDILYVSKRKQPIKTRFSDDVKRKLLEYNHADVYLYNYFNWTLWQRIREYGPDFRRDLTVFRTLLNEKQKECIEGTSVVRGRREFVEYLGMSNSSRFCDLYVDENFVLETKIYRRQGGNVTHPL